MSASQKLGEKLYAQDPAAAAAAAGGASAGGASGHTDDDTVVDAEFKEVKDGKA